MKIGVIGSGGREHALCEAIKNSENVDEIYCIPGNAGTHAIATNVDLNIQDFGSLKISGRGTTTVDFANIDDPVKVRKLIQNKS